MNRIDADWLREFDEAMLGYFAIDRADAGMDERELSWYTDLPPSDAALAHGQDFDPCRVDSFWPTPGLSSRRSTSISYPRHVESEAIARWHTPGLRHGAASEAQSFDPQPGILAGMGQCPLLHKM